ncbi:MAG: type II secretion system protein [Proteobacteria bacterium]|nr:type II secretion system protein [Pseudomonadota bacterium]
MSPTRHRRGFTLVELLVVLCIVGLLASILLPSFARSRAMSLYTACKGNLKNIGTAFAVYASDNNGAYPNSASLVCPRYIAVFPTCPGLGGPNYRVTTAYTPDAYTVVCLGNQHQLVGVPAQYPQFLSTGGLVAP